jgi:PKD repeat protein
VRNGRLTQASNGTSLSWRWGNSPSSCRVKGGTVTKRTVSACGVALGVMALVAGCIYIGNILPIASFTATPTEGTTPLNVAFDASASNDPDGSITTYVWDFGDGQSASLTVATAAHQFTVQSVSKVFRVLLTITDNRGDSAQAAADITVNP